MQYGVGAPATLHINAALFLIKFLKIHG